MQRIDAPSPLGAPLAKDQTESLSRRAVTRFLALLTILGRRLAFGLVVLPAIVFLSYFGLEMARGSTFRPALIWAVTQTPSYILRVFQGDLGVTSSGTLSRRAIPVVELLPTLLSKSLGLLGIALLLATVVGVGLGVWAARRRHSGWSVLAILASIVGVSIPSFFAALLLQFLMIRWTRTVGSSLLPMGGFGWDRHLVLPVLVLAARPIAQIFRVAYVAVGEALDQDYVRTAQSKGLRSAYILLRHIMRNAGVPILTSIGLSLRFSLSSLPIVEFFFGWPGVGFALLKAISRRDDNLTLVLVLCLGLLFILVNLLLDIAYRLLDPRMPAPQSRAGRGEGVGAILRELASDLADGLTRIREYFSRTGSQPVPAQSTELDPVDASHSIVTRQASNTLRRTLNPPLLLGGLLLILLAVVFVLGPQLAPYSPYTTRGLVYENGDFLVPPFAPGAEFVWGTDVLGRDILSLVMAGAQQTLILVAVVAAARMALGIVLGSLAGWRSGGRLDRLLLGASETIAAFPTLFLAMILILALGIRQGLRPFVIAFCFVGWGEIMQFVRAEVMAIRPRPYIESAVTVGLRTPRILTNHVLPNLIPTLISLAALEMGAVLMLLGELGFLSIFIGGGAFAELDIDGAPYHYSDVPEWGALLANVRLYAPAYPWTALYPALAFFIAILGFNLFGEGLRRAVEAGGLAFSRWINRYTVVLAILAILAVGWVRGNTGAVVFYREQAATFDGQRAYALVKTLTDPDLEGRALGSSGQARAAATIAREFEQMGLQRAGEAGAYFQPRTRSYERLDGLPQLTIADGGPAPLYRQDFAEYAGPFRNLGQVTGPVRALTMQQLDANFSFGANVYPALKGLDFTGEVLLLLDPQDSLYLRGVGPSGLLIVVDDPSQLQARHTLSTRAPFFAIYGTGRQVGQEIPNLLISPALADRLLAGSGESVASLRSQRRQLSENELLDVATQSTVSISISGTVLDNIPTQHVAAYMPGQAGHVPGSLQKKLDQEMIVVLAQYDGPPIGPDGVTLPGANDNASGVALLLEAARTLIETGYEPSRTFLFVAYAGEGLDGGQSVQRPEAADFLKAHYGFDQSYEPVAVVRLRGVGGGSGEGLLISAQGSMRLTRLFEQAADKAGVSIHRADDELDISVIFTEGSARDSGLEVPEIGLSWAGWQDFSATPEDTAETVSPDKLAQAGRVLAEVLMVVGRELDY